MTEIRGQFYNGGIKLILRSHQATETTPGQFFASAILVNGNKSTINVNGTLKGC
jgi:hypothetical protein